MQFLLHIYNIPIQTMDPGRTTTKLERFESCPSAVMKCFLIGKITVTCCHMVVLFGQKLRVFSWDLKGPGS